MRELLFKAKRESDGYWVEGFYFERKDTKGIVIDAFIISDGYEQIRYGQRHFYSALGGNECHRVLPETVGQYCLNVKDDKKLFEGEIFHFNGEVFVCRWDQGNVEFGAYNKKESMGMAYFPRYDIEIVGNIHDNPELLVNP